VTTLEDVYASVADKYLGWKLKKNSVRNTKKYVNGELVYEAKVTVDSLGLRATPSCIGSCDSAILFFGNSFMYGEGLDDSSTLPWQFSKMCDDRYPVYNFAVHGYGPHQTLAQIEFNFVTDAVQEDVKYIICQVLYPEHIQRICGVWEWTAYGPKYILDHNSQPQYSGNIKPSLLKYLIQKGFFTKSAFIRHLTTYHKKVTPDQKELFKAIFLKSASLLKETYPDPEFHILLWDWTHGADNYIFDALASNDITIHDITSILPDNGLSNMKYKISPYDKHPNAFANKLIADYIVSHIIQYSREENDININRK
jgi:hypothetical protein